MAWGGTSAETSAAEAATRRLRLLESECHTPCETRGTQRVFASYPANLYHLFTNISADCAPSRARLFARHSRDVSRAVATGTRGNTRHRMTGTITVTAVSGPANTCGKTRPL